MANPEKRAKLDDGSVANGEEKITLHHLNNFRLERVLKDVSEKKFIALLGTFPELNPHSRAVVTLEKSPFGGEGDIKEDVIKEVKLKMTFWNDKYGKFEADFPEGLNTGKVNVIYPATEMHIQKFESSNSCIIYETSDLYQTVTLPAIKRQSFEVRWVDNILKHEKEADMIIFEDPDPIEGFILLPDYKWDGKNLSTMYLVAIVHSHNIRSLRELTGEHLNLLTKIWVKGCAAIEEKFGIVKSRIRAYFHYQPSYYHLHVHFSQCDYSPPGINVEKAHLLPTVIDNLRRRSSHYANATLPFVAVRGTPIFKAYEDAKYFQAEKTTAKDLLSFFRKMGKAKHDPCSDQRAGVTYGESAWRMAIMALCLPTNVDRNRLVQVALSSAFSSLGEAEEQIRSFGLPAQKSSELIARFNDHAQASKGLHGTSKDAEELAIYNKILNFETALTLAQKSRKNDEESNDSALLSKMVDVGFYGHERLRLFNDDSTLRNLLKFFLKISELCSLKRAGWVRMGVQAPETVAGHMFRMGVMAWILQDGDGDDTMQVSLVHDLAECIVGDITPVDKVPAEQKHKMEMDAMRSLVQELPSHLAGEIFGSFDRYESQPEGDFSARLTKDLDKLDMLIQAQEYEDDEGKPGWLQGFFKSTPKSIFKSEAALALIEALLQERSAKN